MKKTVIVCGMPRSGTRSVANILNASKDIYVTAEFPSGVTSKMFRLVDSMTDFFKKRTYKDFDGWTDKKEELVHDIWLANSVFGGDKNALKFIGNKTPSNELFLNDFERTFETNKPVYIYCARSPLKVIASLNNMPWNKETPLENWERWKASFDIYQRMFSLFPERVLLVSFDDPEDGSFTEVGTKIFNLIGLNISESILKGWKNSKPAQPKESVLKGKEEKKLEQGVIEIIKKDDYYKMLSEKYNYLTE